MLGNVINENLLQEIETLQLLVKNNVAGAYGGNRRSKTYGSSCEFVDYREYIAGDDVTKIDWNSYARFGTLYTKLFLDERQMHTRIYIDASRSMEHGRSKKAEQALKLSACFAYLSVREMDKVSILTMNGSTLTEVVGGMVGREAYTASIQKLNEVRFDGECKISEAILPSKVGYGDGLSIIISDFLTDDDYEQAIDLLASKRRHVLCVQILSQEEINPLIRGKVHFYDSEISSKTYRKNIDKDVAIAYKKALDYATKRLENFCLARGADYMLVNAEDNISKIFYTELMEKGVLK